MKTKMKKARVAIATVPELSSQDAPLSAFLSLFNASTEVRHRSKSRDTWFFDLLKTEEREGK
jgi:hypothetical protein